MCERCDKIQDVLKEINDEIKKASKVTKGDPIRADVLRTVKAKGYEKIKELFSK